MRLPPIVLILAAGLGTAGVSQMLTPTVQAQSPKSAPVLPAAYQVLVNSLCAKPTAGGLEVTGEVVNTGRQTLTYTSVAIVLSDAHGQEAARGNGYLTAGPLCPGQSAEVRSSILDTAAYTHITLIVKEAGHPVAVEIARIQSLDAQASDSHRTTVW